MFFKIQIYILGFLGLSSQFLLAANFNHSKGSFQGAVGSFFTKWENYRNHWAEFEASYYSGSQSRFTFEIKALARTDSNWPVLGNINQAIYKQNSWLEWGRLPARNEESLVSLDRHLNHRVCQTPLSCSLGGPIGTHFNVSQVKISIEWLSLPNISPTPKIYENGVLESKYRWTDIAYQFVEIDNNFIPLRVSSVAHFDAQTFLSPGIIVDLPVNWANAWKSNFILASQRSKSVFNKSDDGLLVINDPIEGPFVAVNSEQNLKFPWQHLILMNTSWALSKGSALELNLGIRESVERALESTIKYSYKWNILKLETNLGHHKMGAYNFSSLDAKISYKIYSHTVGMNSLYIFSKEGRSFWLEPSWSYAWNRSLSTFANSLLMTSTPQEKLLSKHRAQDQIIAGMKYDF